MLRKAPLPPPSPPLQPRPYTPDFLMGLRNARSLPTEAGDHQEAESICFANDSQNFQKVIAKYRKIDVAFLKASSGDFEYFFD